MSSHPVAELLARLPEGWSAVRYRDRRWGVSRTRQAGGRIEKVYAEELGGTGVISANLYLPGGTEGDGDEQLRPCEMPASDVLDFLRGWHPSFEAGTPEGGHPGLAASLRTVGETGVGEAGSELHGDNLGDQVLHTRPESGEKLAASRSAVNRAFDGKNDAPSTAPSANSPELTAKTVT